MTRGEIIGKYDMRARAEFGDNADSETLFDLADQDPRAAAMRDEFLAELKARKFSEPL
jgi:hypothetical protein